MEDDVLQRRQAAFQRLPAILWLVLAPGPGLLAQAVDRRSVGECTAYATRLAEYEAFVQNEMRVNRIPGLTVGFFKDDCTWVAAFGQADLENHVPASVDSAYRYASVQKSMTAAAVLQLADQGKLDLDAEVQRYVSHFPRKRWPVTVSYFDKAAASGDQTPVYAIRFEVYENGASRALMLDYNDFSIGGELTSIEFKESRPCR